MSSVARCRAQPCGHVRRDVATGTFSANYDLHAFHPNYDVAPDGHHFVMVISGDSETQLVVVTNWLEELWQRLVKR
jgi:hypothetical protein